MLQTLALTMLALGAPALQEDAGEQTGPPVFSISELTIKHYTPVSVPAYELEHIIGEMVGRSFYLRERGGYSGDPIDNLTRVGNSLLLYDTEEYLERVLATLQAIDQERGDAEQPPEDPDITFHYTPRYLSMGDLWSVVENLTPNMSAAGDRRILVVHDYASVIREVEELLAKVDVPEPQILVTAYLVRGWSSGDGGPPLPEDLREHLGRLVPGLDLQVAGFAMLQSSVQPKADLRLRLTGSGTSEDYYLSFAPSAYDGGTGSLSVERCDLTQNTSAGPRVVFSTSTVFRGGEYTVLGATGEKPLFVVVRLTEI